jgi:prepilin-type N-terminal cleavage/methylation domain-containing protein
MTVKRSEQGFSLVELMIVLVILTIVMGVIFQQIVSLQQRYKTEEIKADIFSEAREFTDQFVRDIHQTGYPGKTVYTAAALGAPPENDNRLAVGIVSATPTDLQLEADVDGDGLVDSVRYTLIAGEYVPLHLAAEPSDQAQRYGAMEPAHHLQYRGAGHREQYRAWRRRSGSCYQRDEPYR